MLRDVHGILLLDKPVGLTSAGAVARIKRLFNACKAGHTGSLDPLASGLLPICFGEATKFGAPLLDADKTYRVTMRLGERTPSADRESAVVERRVVPAFTPAQLADTLDRFPRSYSQVPPMHSALKHNGRPLYEYARAGVTLERSPRTITIHALHLLEWHTPDLSFEVHCSKGAYIRVLAEDLAASLGNIGHLAELRRTAVAPFVAEAVWQFEALEALAASDRHALLLPVDAALSGCPRLDLSAIEVLALRQGRPIAVPQASCGPPCGQVRMYSTEVGFLGLGLIDVRGWLAPLRLIAGPVADAGERCTLVNGA